MSRDKTIEVECPHCGIKTTVHLPDFFGERVSPSIGTCVHCNEYFYYYRPNAKKRVTVVRR